MACDHCLEMRRIMRENMLRVMSYSTAQLKHLAAQARGAKQVLGPPSAQISLTDAEKKDQQWRS